MSDPDINAFMNPYQRFVIDEPNRQAEIQQNRIAAEVAQEAREVRVFKELNKKVPD